MNIPLLVRTLIIIMIIGGVIIIFLGRPWPEPEPICIVCGSNAIRLLGIAESVLGVITLGLVSKLTVNNKVRQNQF